MIENIWNEILRNAFTRGREHWRGIVKKSKDSPLYVNGIKNVYNFKGFKKVSILYSIIT